MKKIIQSALLSSLFATSFSVLATNPEPVIFGTVTHANGESVTGTIRWGDDGESFLSDIFNGIKLKTNGIEHLTDDEIHILEESQPGPKASIGDVEITFKSFFGKELKLPFFNVPFGAIDRIDIKDDIFTVTLHDGSSFQTKDEVSNSDDTSDDIYVKSKEGAVVEFEIENLSSVVFSAAPTDAKTFNNGIYGIINSELGTFQGRVMWDKDERTLAEELDGNDESQEHEIKFTAIKSLEKVNDGKATKVVLKDGQKLILTGTNDVNNGHRGIWLDNPKLGRVEIKWSQFEMLVIQHVDVAWLNFDAYVKQAKQLSGTVTLQDDTTFKADVLIYDLNQQSQAELLYVDVNGANRQIPLKTIKKITKKHNKAVELSMRDGSHLLAYGNRSVTFENNGILGTANGESKWHQWQDIKSLEFD